MRVAIERVVYGGDGLGRAGDGRTVLVPFTLPGEWAELDQDKRLIGIEEPSSGRVEPGCQHFGRCGGCQYQHATYQLQISLKADILSETLERVGLRNRPKIEVHASEPWGYRNRIRLRVEGGRVGYNVRQTNEFLPIAECPISAPVLWRTAATLVSLGESSSLCRQWLGSTEEVEISTTADQGAVQVLLHLRERRSSGFARFCGELLGAVPELVGVGVAGGESWGKGGLTYVLERKSYWVSRGGFFQVNRFLLDELVRIVTDGRNGLLAWDLFAGVGLFSRVLADGFGEVVAVEANATAIRDLAAAKVGNVRGVAGSVVEFLRQAAVGRERPELVVMDPPRAGAGKEVSELLARLQVPQIVYVSCDPTTLARDLRVMVDSGYDLAELHLVDLFPQTYHLETVAVLQR